MTYRLPRFHGCGPRVGRVFAPALAFAAALLAAACGRSSLDDDLGAFSDDEGDASAVDGSTDASSDVRVIDARVVDVRVVDGSPPPTDAFADVGSCGPSTCPTGCCHDGTCNPGFTTIACGSFGDFCDDCTNIPGTTCTPAGSNGYACLPPPPPPTCSPSNCSGCCDSNGQCQGGFVDTVCGQNGASCLDCTALMSTCDTNTTPRVCTSQQTVCPGTYNACPSTLQTTPHPLHQNVCSSSDLANLAEACANGAHTTACQSFFSFEAQQSAKCGACLAPFDYDYTELNGLLACIAPFVDTTCNHESACVADCTVATCSQCPDPQSELQCESDAVQTGTCAQYVQNIQGCATVAFVVNAPFCSPGPPPESFGTWFAGVGQEYCGN